MSLHAIVDSSHIQHGKSSDIDKTTSGLHVADDVDHLETGRPTKKNFYLELLSTDPQELQLSFLYRSAKSHRWDSKVSSASDQVSCALRHDALEEVAHTATNSFKPVLDMFFSLHAATSKFSANAMSDLNRGGSSISRVDLSA